MIRIESHHVFLRDLKSTNGTFIVNGSQIQRLQPFTWHHWQPGQTVKFGGEFSWDKEGDRPDMVTTATLQMIFADCSSAASSEDGLAPPASSRRRSCRKLPGDWLSKSDFQEAELQEAEFQEAALKAAMEEAATMAPPSNSQV